MQSKSGISMCDACYTKGPANIPYAKATCNYLVVLDQSMEALGARMKVRNEMCLDLRAEIYLKVNFQKKKNLIIILKVLSFPQNI